MIATKRTGLIPAVLYLRMSTDKQEASISTQRKAVEVYARDNGYRIIREYIDEGISGAESGDGRPSFKRLIADAQGRDDFDVVLCWDQDRFSRFDPLEANHYWFLLRQANVRIVTVCQGELDLENLGGWLMASVAQHGKAQYLRDLSRNVMRGLLAKAQRGEWIHKQAPYGYAVTPERTIVLGDAEHVATVRWIFETYADGEVTVIDMANELNQRGTPAPGGGQWKMSSIRNIIARDIYVTGKALQFREQKGKFHTVRNGVVVPIAADAPALRAPEDWLSMDCPPIIDQKLWDRVQKVLEMRKRFTSPKRGRGPARLTGLLYCGHCGQPMYSQILPGKIKGKPAIAYFCSSYNAQGRHACQRNMIRETAIVGFLVDKIRNAVIAPETLERLKAIVCRKAEGKGRGKAAPATDTKRLRSQLAKLDKDIRDAVKELKRTPDDLYESVVSDLRELRAERDRLATALEPLEAPPTPRAGDTDQTVARALAQLETLRKEITDDTPSVARKALSKICERVDLWFEHVKSKKQTRSVFKKGLAKFNGADLLTPATKPD